MTIARRTSQVCNMWRTVMLDSPSLWANIIDLRQSQGHWREEVIRRTGTSPLSIRGYFDGSNGSL
ncbi:hypothetical protein CPB84DRAFT_1764891, partial [Gymnopilus junonius]